MHILLVKFVLRSLGVTSIPWVEVSAFTGYSFVPISLSVVCGLLAGAGARRKKRCDNNQRCMTCSVLDASWQRRVSGTCDAALKRANVASRHRIEGRIKTSTMQFCRMRWDLLADVILLPEHSKHFIFAGRIGYWASFVYGSLCTAIFLVRTLKRVIYQEAKNYGRFSPHSLRKTAVCHDQCNSLSAF